MLEVYGKTTGKHVQYQFGTDEGPDRQDIVHLAGALNRKICFRLM